MENHILDEKCLQILYSEILEILKYQYPLAKKAYLRLETKERIKALSSVTDLRDVFDHLYRAVKIVSSDIEDKEKVLYSEITSANEHLRRAAIEPLETAIEDLLAKIIEKAKYNYILLFFRISKVPNEKITEHLEEARHTLYEVRMNKGQMDRLTETIEKMEKQQEDLRLLDSNLPTKITIKILFGLLCTLFLGVIVGMLIG